jgi:hypothetical protein
VEVSNSESFLALILVACPSGIDMVVQRRVIADIYFLRFQDSGRKGRRHRSSDEK